MEAAEIPLLCVGLQGGGMASDGYNASDYAHRTAIDRDAGVSASLRLEPYGVALDGHSAEAERAIAAQADGCQLAAANVDVALKQHDIAIANKGILKGSAGGDERAQSRRVPDDGPQELAGRECARSDGRSGATGFGYPW